MLKTLLIANRGEIACRVMRTARRMGIRTVAVYSDADARALHVQMADAAVRLGPPPPRESYLNIGAVLDAAKGTGADAIHPGYGFLSENAEFAEACARAGIAFVGPPAGAIRAMGLKDRAKALMARSGVPVVPGYLGDDQSTDHLAAEAAKIGYPVLIKAVAGGGGKGMRKVEAAPDFAAALEGAKREAKSAFNDDKVLLEKYVSRPRHIEVQVFADTHGNAVHLFERDCSLQRRHQKVIEEAPAPGMSEAMRKSIGEAAVKAAKAVNYVGAGTIEFIADASEGLRSDRVWFMEMNTRLQVEHPVTEAITGTDLVEWQLRVASGERLPKMQDDLVIHGRAIEVRLYAEDPDTGFLPSIGKLERFSIPDDKVRVDTGVRECDMVTPFYDPMIAKVIAHADSREATAAKLSDALAHTFVAGVKTNNAFLIRALRHKDFLSGEVDTGFIARHGHDLIPHTAAPADAYRMAAAALTRMAVPKQNDPWAVYDGFRNSGQAAQSFDFLVDGKRKGVALPGIQVRRNAEVQQLANGDVAVMEDGETWLVRPYDPFEAAEAAGDTADRVATPMPGKIIQVLVKPGETVKKGQALAVLEAMKMEHTLAAPSDADVSTVEVQPGDQVPDGTVVVRFKQQEQKAA
ncbi:MAG: acetyl/propionyl/methylcrotonyl-CoA carboxylase subunit alpha [Alphaproteobacteria bacterium]|nr:acetyl/propionyl/methylcrotonyl-CoA carboxylase subunit alpha [Alphaproteobacteria bacterium]MBL6939559.1 acetyl/propionyl/methylcrotonyl-CoA carboxylase subunit alpha [Alphaproteobacteria bacterium]MBL7100068.1 acetyl/propionyl/methylcrotonyl-CoA carboxylase subunit alpha [Alphaproteobacteria bacterium]